MMIASIQVFQTLACDEVYEVSLVHFSNLSEQTTCNQVHTPLYTVCGDKANILRKDWECTMSQVIPHSSRALVATTDKIVSAWKSVSVTKLM